MDYSESTKVVFHRIEKVDPENVYKIIGHLLLKDNAELDMIRLAFCPDTIIQSTIHAVKRELINHSYLSPTNVTPNFTPSCWSSAPENSQWIVPTTHHDPLVDQNFQYYPLTFVEPSPPPPPAAAVGGGYGVHNKKQPQIQIRCSHFPESTTTAQLICQSFSQGYCKYGGSCRFLHVLRIENGSFMVLNPPPKAEVEDNCVLSHESLKQLEIELIALLKARRAVPVSISSLPIFYYEKYGKVLQVGGYLMEVPEQGKVSFTLAQLIGWMNKGICLIERPHGRQSIILVEDIPRFMRLVEERSGEDEWKSCQVYLTFLPDSMFTEEDVYNYFNKFGPVDEVRLPSQEKRMFGFVTFVYPETVTLVLTKTNPHFICEAKVLVKPYRIKPMLVDRKPEERVVQHPIQLGVYIGDHAESRPSSTEAKDECDQKLKFLKKQVMMEGLRNKKHVFVGQTSSASASASDQSEDASSSCFKEGVVLSNGWGNDEDRAHHIKACNYYYNQLQESSFDEEVNLPESPFGYDEVANGVWPLTD